MITPSGLARLERPYCGLPFVGIASPPGITSSLISGASYGSFCAIFTSVARLNRLDAKPCDHFAQAIAPPRPEIP